MLRDRPQLLLCVAAALLACAGADDRRDRPNLLIVVADDMGLQLGAYGDAQASTPTLDAFAASGLRFERAFAAAPVCSPSRAAMLTGLFPHANGHWGFPEDTRLHAGIRTLPDYLNEAGYRTGLVGKLHVGAHEAAPSDSRAPQQIPFEVYRRIEQSGRDEPARYGAAVAEFLAGADERPFFLWVATHAPHAPYPGRGGQPPWPEPHDPARVPVPAAALDTPAFRALLATMYDAYALADTVAAAVLGALEDAGLAERTLVLYTSDHGPALPGAKTTLFDPGVRVPLLARWPGAIAPGRSHDALVSGVDLLPTLLELAGVAPPAALHGRSFAAALRGHGEAGADAVYAEHTKSQGNRYYPQRALRTARFKYVRTLRPDIDRFHNSMARWMPPLLQRWHVDAHARLLARRNVRHAREELFDLGEDPDELRDLARDPTRAETLAALRARLRRWMRETDDPWIALWDERDGGADPFEPARTRDGPFRTRWLDGAIARVPAATAP